LMLLGSKKWCSLCIVSDQIRPDAHGFSAKGSIVGGCHAVALNMKQVGNRSWIETKRLRWRADVKCFMIRSRRRVG